MSYYISFNSANDRIGSSLVTNVKTITTSASTLSAGASAKSSRIQMVVYNESSVTVYYGAASVTTLNGMPLNAGESVTFNFDSNTAVDIYFIANSNANVRVVEI